MLIFDFISYEDCELCNNKKTKQNKKPQKTTTQKPLTRVIHIFLQ